MVRSPPTRGSVARSDHVPAHGSPLPAHAGVSRYSSTSAAAIPPAPRPRGGQSFGGNNAQELPSRSPPTRGSVEPAHHRGRRAAPLPAHAGVSRSMSLSPTGRSAAPRPRGGQSFDVAITDRAQRRSPPTRGSVAGRGHAMRAARPLPAHAGVSRRTPPRDPASNAAPRPRGGQSVLSAHAGVSRHRPGSRVMPRAAPRPRGGQSVKLSQLSLGTFRSPPTRGSVGGLASAGRCRRPLPAHAGVSRCLPCYALRGRPAPRPRGGQSQRILDALQPEVRSPPTRGSVGRARRAGRGRAPLPAHAGVSRVRPCDTSADPTAPRPRGGQSPQPGLRFKHAYRSPPTRGSVANSNHTRWRATPLPAHAGVSRYEQVRGGQVKPAPRPRGGQSSSRR